MNRESVQTNEALLVIDVQNEYSTGLLPVSYPPGSLDTILKAMDRAHAASIPVVVIRHTSTAPEAAAFRRGTYGWELHEAVRQRPADVLIEKTLPGSFTGTPLGDWLQERAVSTIAIAGYMTHMCCDTTARQAFHRGFSVRFLSDATGTLALANSAGSISAQDLHAATLVTQQQRFARVMTTDEWIRRL
jgi:nicotinamidase-related amidase